MLIVKNSIVSDDIVDRRFCCDLSQCKGQCCVEGDCGAPLLEEEIPILEQILPQVEPYMTEAGKAVVQSEGVATLNNAAEPCTPLVNNRECAYKKRQMEYFTALLERLGASAECTWVFEDALYAMESAKAAGLRVCAIEENTQRKDREAIMTLADVYVRDYGELFG